MASDATIIGKTTTHRVTSGCGYLYIQVVKDNDGIINGLFISVKAQSQCMRCQLQTISRLFARAVQAGADPVSIARGLRGVSCERIKQNEPKAADVLSCSDAIAQVLLKELGLADEARRYKHPSLAG
jgi:hypothetical protein